MADFSKLVEMQDRKNTVITQALALSEDKGDFNAERQASVKKLMAESLEIQAGIDSYRAVHAAAAELEKVERAGIRPGLGKTEAGEKAERDETINKIQDRYLRFGLSKLTAAENAILEGRKVSLIDGVQERDMETTSLGSGGYTVAPEFYKHLLESEKLYANVENAGATQITTATGADMPAPMMDDSSSSNVATIVGEAASVGTDNDLSFSSKSLKAYIYKSGVIKLTYAMIQDSAFDIQSLLAKKLGERLSRGQNQHFSTGTGSGQPEGIITTCPIGWTTASSPTVVGWEDLSKLMLSVDPAYRAHPNAKFMFSDAVFAQIFLEKDSLGRPIWSPGVSADAPDRVFGKQYVINQGFADPASGALVATFGDHSAYMIRNTGGVQILRLDQLYLTNLEIGYVGFQRRDGRLLDAGTGPVKSLKMHA